MNWISKFYFWFDIQMSIFVKVLLIKMADDNLGTYCQRNYVEETVGGVQKDIIILEKILHIIFYYVGFVMIN